MKKGYGTGGDCAESYIKTALPLYSKDPHFWEVTI